MATGEIAHASRSFGADNAAAALRLGRDGSVITRDFITQLALEGKIFIAGIGLEGTATTGRTSLAETTPDLVLKAPSGGTKAIIPLYFESLISAEGGAAPDWYINVVTNDTSIATAGTTVTPQSLGVRGGVSAAVIQTAPTLSAYTSADNVLLANAQNTLDNIISTEGATTVVLSNDMMNTPTKIWWPKQPLPAPIVLRDGQMWCFYSVTGTTGQDHEWTLLFAEVDVAAYF